MDSDMWCRVAKSNMIITMANAKHIMHTWRRAMFIIMRLQEMIALHPRVYIPDTTPMDDTKMNILMYTVIDKTNDSVNPLGCTVHYHDGIVYCGSTAVMAHVVKLGKQKED